MSEVFEPRNELETKLLAAQEGTLDIDTFMDEFLKAQVFMPVHDDKRIGNFQRSKSAKPLALDAEDGSKMLVLFTSPERARAFVKDYPGWEVGLDLEPQDVAELARRQQPPQVH